MIKNSHITVREQLQPPLLPQIIITSIENILEAMIIYLNLTMHTIQSHEYDSFSHV